MPNKTSKKRLILDCDQARRLERFGPSEIRAIAADFRQRFGGDHQISPSYIANVLRQAGKHVEYEDRYVDPWMEEPYARRLQGLLEFRDFAAAEASLQKLNDVYQEYRAVSDRVGTSLVRSLVLKGKARAESLAANPRVRPEKQREKQEIARWFRVWLETSDLFFDWLELRKRSQEYQQAFVNPDGGGTSDSAARQK